MLEIILWSIVGVCWYLQWCILGYTLSRDSWKKSFPSWTVGDRTGNLIMASVPPAALLAALVWFLCYWCSARGPSRQKADW